MKIKIITVSIITFFIVYGLARSSDIFLGSPFHFSLSKESSTRMAIVGNAKFSKHILINGDETMVDTAGDFKYEFSPLPGVNVVTIETKDSFGNYREETHSFVYNNEQGIKTAQK
jgi:hypothetical protein